MGRPGKVSNTCLLQEGGFTDVFIAGTGEWMQLLRMLRSKPSFARSAAVNFVDGDANVPIRSKNAHYVTRHQICGKMFPVYDHTLSPMPTICLCRLLVRYLLTGWVKGGADYRMFHHDGRGGNDSALWILLCLCRT